MLLYQDVWRVQVRGVIVLSKLIQNTRLSSIDMNLNLFLDILQFSRWASTQGSWGRVHSRNIIVLAPYSTATSTGGRWCGRGHSGDDRGRCF